MAEFPKSFDDPAYDAADSSAAATAGIDPILLRSIRTRGERSNADQVSSKGATTPYQFIPATRKAILDKYGIDVTLNPQNASLGAAYLLKEGIDRNGGDASAAVAEYHGGIDRKQHGPVNRAYVDRVMMGAQDDFLDQLAQDVAQSAGSPQGSTEAAQAQTSADAGAVDPLDELAASIAAEPTIGQKVMDVVTGDLRKTPETEAAPDWTQLPEYANDFGAAGWKAALGTTFTNPEETAQVLKAQFPGVQVRQDEKGNYFIRSAEDGQEYAIKPGFRASDIPRALGSVAAFTPVGRAVSIPGQAAAAGGIQAAIEGTQAATGGEFNPEDVALAGALGAAVPLVSRGVGALAGKLGSGADDAAAAARAAPEPPKATPKPEPPPTAEPAQQVKEGPSVWTWRTDGQDHPVDIIDQTFTSPVNGREYQRVRYQGKETYVPKDELMSPESAAARSEAQTVQAAAVEAPPITPEAPPAPPVEPLAADDLTAIAKEAATGSGRAQARAQQILAEQAAPDTETVAAAKRLGIEDNLQPDHVTTSQVFRELSQAVKSIPGSEARAQELEGLQAVARRADDLVGELGGTKDLSTLSDNVKNRMVATIDDLEGQANKLYADIRENIPRDARVSAPTTLEFIQGRARSLGGAENLTPLEKRIVAKLTPKTRTTTERVPGRSGVTTGSSRQVESSELPRYGLMDDIRTSVGQAARMQGPFKDADTGLAKKLYSLITADQEAAIQPFGMTETINAAKAAVRTRKALEDDAVSLFGKSLSSSLVGNLAGGVQGLGKGDTSKFLKLINAVPQAMRQEVTASALNYGFRNGAKAGDLNFRTFAQWFEGLSQNRQAYNALMANLPKEAPQMLKDLYRISSGISAASKERIMTGRLNAITKELQGPDSALQRVYQAASKVAGVTALEAATSTVGAPGAGLAAGITSALMKGKPDVMKAADKLISDPAFISMAKSSMRGEQPKPSTVKHLAKSAQMRQFFQKAGRPPEMRNHEEWLMGLFQSANESQN